MLSKKYYISILLFLIVQFVTKIKPQIVKCDYLYQNHWIVGYKTTNSSYYKCDLDTTKANYYQNISGIGGAHKAGHSDRDVKWISMYIESKLMKLSSIFCQKFPNLEVIRISDTELIAVDENSLVNCRNLEHLLLDGNRLQVIPEFMLVRNTKLTLILLDQNQLTFLPENLFTNQAFLETLDLNDNLLRFIPSNTFRSLFRLESLQLFNNQLQSINPQWFASLQNLRRLGLNGNQILEIPSRCFASLRSLEQLFLYENRIEVLKSDSFVGLQNLQVLNLRDNNLSVLPVGVFLPLINLQETSLNDNKLSIIHSASFGVHSHLARIYFGNNRINAIDPKLIDNTAVSLINMANNVCSQLHAESRNEIVAYLKRCFSNYQPRTGQSQNYNPYPIIFEKPKLNCGRVKNGRGNIIGGVQTKSGDYPWTAVLMTPKGKYFCGGVLISNRKVITAAHCIQEKKSSVRLSANNLIVLLGAHDLNKNVEIGRAFYAVYGIYVHPDWNTFTQAYDADIAVLVLEKEVTFNEHIQPICLTLPNSNIASISTGAVFGYGKSEDVTKIHENIPKILNIPIHNNRNCFKDNSGLALISSGRTFCGGSGKGVGVCTGDSGSGLIVTDGSSYYLRGIVSSSLLTAQRGCDVNTYAVFTDVLKFLDWINLIPTDRFAIGRT